MAVSVFDLFSIGIGPSSSHTVGSMRAAATFAAEAAPLHPTRVLPQLFGSLGATGHGHGSENAVLWGLEGESPETVDTDLAPQRAAKIKAEKRLLLDGKAPLPFDPDHDLVLHRRRSLPFHPNGMTFTAWQGTDDLMRVSAESGRSIAEVMLANEIALLTGSSDVSDSEVGAQVRAGLLKIWQVMIECVDVGCHTPGVPPGGLRVDRRAAALNERLLSDGGRFRNEVDPLSAMDWVTLWALAVNEENAAGGRVVTAPTNGAAGIIPAVLHYAANFVPGVDDDAIVEFLLVAGAIGSIYQQTASISGAEVGCQGEVGSACSMAAAALAHLLGGTTTQVENAAEIGLEHHLGLTCDPVGGLVQIPPCIERNAVASVKAITVAGLAIYGTGTHKVSLDKVMETMMQTGADMSGKYKETARGGLAVNMVEC